MTPLRPRLVADMTRALRIAGAALAEAAGMAGIAAAVVAIGLAL
jgi:hypothetical protein